jgi:exopolyphosphatase/pppGpp-phosphohydrolase
MRSLEIGSLRLTHACLRRDPPRAREVGHAREAVRAALVDVRPPVPDLVFATGGSSRALGKVLGRRYDAEALDALIPKLARRGAAKRAERFGVHPLRAETIVAGAVVLAEVARLLGRPFDLARGGLREGAALRLAAVEAVAA